MKPVTYSSFSFSAKYLILIFTFTTLFDFNQSLNIYNRIKRTEKNKIKIGFHSELNIEEIKHFQSTHKSFEVSSLQIDTPKGIQLSSMESSEKSQNKLNLKGNSFVYFPELKSEQKDKEYFFLFQVKANEENKKEILSNNYLVENFFKKFSNDDWIFLVLPFTVIKLGNKKQKEIEGNLSLNNKMIILPLEMENSDKINNKYILKFDLKEGVEGKPLISGEDGQSQILQQIEDFESNLTKRINELKNNSLKTYESFLKAKTAYQKMKSTDAPLKPEDALKIMRTTKNFHKHLDTLQAQFNEFKYFIVDIHPDSYLKEFIFLPDGTKLSKVEMEKINYLTPILGLNSYLNETIPVEYKGVEIPEISLEEKLELFKNLIVGES